MANRGLMAENMFTGKAAILSWLNSALSLRLERIEDTCNGALACQLMDCLHPGSVNMRRVDFNAKLPYEFVSNYKQLQEAFDKAGIDKTFNVQGLSKGKLQDNNEFMQWFKGYWDSVTGGAEVDDYDAPARRQLAKTGDWKRFSTAGGGGGGGGGASARAGAESAAVRHAAPQARIAAHRPGVARGGSLPPASPAQAGGRTPAAAKLGAAARAGSDGEGSPAAGLTGKRLLAGGAGDVAEVAARKTAEARAAELEREVRELRLENESMRAGREDARAGAPSPSAELAEALSRLEETERERDFYFDKLRDVEILVGAPEIASFPIASYIERILYAAEGEEAKLAVREAQARFCGAAEGVGESEGGAEGALAALDIAGGDDEFESPSKSVAGEALAA